MRKPDNIHLGEDERSLTIIDQTLLPGELKYLRLTSREELFEAITSLRVRGAPAIGIFAAYALYVLATSSKATSYQEFLEETKENEAFLNAARPTAVNLCNMTRRMRELVEAMHGESVQTVVATMKAEALAIQEQDAQMCKEISAYGLSLLKEGDGVLTYCNAGELATSLYGTGLGPLILAQERGIELSAWCPETRPLLQGSRLTTFELQRAGINCTLICDNMVSHVMREGKIQACLVGCDRVARNGDTANKIGTSAVAILAKHYGIPFYVLGPSSSIDFDCKSGAEITIEYRSADEIKNAYFSEPSALSEVAAYNPSFDVTDCSLITAIITERGICTPPFEDSFNKYFEEKMS